LNQTNTTYYVTDLIPGLPYNITITAYGNARKSKPYVQNFATGKFRELVVGNYLSK